MLDIYNYLALYIDNNVNNMTFVGSYCLFLALLKLYYSLVLQLCFYKHQRSFSHHLKFLLKANMLVRSIPIAKIGLNFLLIKLRAFAFKTKI